jgi:ubiquinone/menaquinone biosynthesis C-methylase UbiE
MPEGTHVILEVRTLARSHRRLAELLKPGLSVLDVGCGTGAITRGMAEAVGPHGRVVGLDEKEPFITGARREYAGVQNLSFEVGDAYTLAREGAFDIVTTARVLQWLAHPARALRAMAGAAKPGGRVVVLDYNHEKIVWTPEPPPSVRAFYRAFLRWRADAGMDNAIADHLHTLFVTSGLFNVSVTPQHEKVTRDDPQFETFASIWAEVAASRGHRMVADGAITEGERALAESECRAWVRGAATAQTMYMLAADGVRPT